jgi:hypothetical protein
MCENNPEGNTNQSSYRGNNCRKYVEKQSDSQLKNKEKYIKNSLVFSFGNIEKII